MCIQRHISHPLLIAVAALAMLAIGWQSAAAQPERSRPPDVCPDGWHRVTPPLNPVLLCLPANLAPVD